MNKFIQNCAQQASSCCFNEMEGVLRNDLIDFSNCINNYSKACKKFGFADWKIPVVKTKSYQQHKNKKLSFLQKDLGKRIQLTVILLTAVPPCHWVLSALSIKATIIWESPRIQKNWRSINVSTSLRKTHCVLIAFITTSWTIAGQKNDVSKITAIKNIIQISKEKNLKLIVIISEV